VDDLWATKSEDVVLIALAISFQDFHHYVVMIHQRHRQMICDCKTALRTIVLHVERKKLVIFHAFAQKSPVGNFSGENFTRLWSFKILDNLSRDARVQ